MTSYLFVAPHYPQKSVQIIVACICYVAAYIFVCSVMEIDSSTYDKYKCYVLSIVAIDAIFWAYRTKNNRPKTESKIILDKDDDENKNVENNAETTEKQSELRVPELSMMSQSSLTHSTTLNSEMYDYHLVHDTTTTDNNVPILS